MAKPLPEPVKHGVFGQTVNAPIEPDVEDVAALTAEHAYEMIVLLAEVNVVQDALRTGEDPRTGRAPRTPETSQRLAKQLAADQQRLTTAYAEAVAAYAEGFGDEAASALDLWVRKTLADEAAHSDAYEPTHPWHYFHAGDNATPLPEDNIPADPKAGQYVERHLPKHPKKRLAKLHALLIREREQLEVDLKRYSEIAARGAEALSRYDREIAHTSDALARASALALRYRHISLARGRVQWMELELERLGATTLFTDADVVSETD